MTPQRSLLQDDPLDDFEPPARILPPARSVQAVILIAALVVAGCHAGDPDTAPSSRARRTAGFGITATVNGIAAQPPLVVNDGDRVVLESVRPVQWVTSSDGASAQTVVSTSTSWRGNVFAGLPQPSGLARYTVQARTLPSSLAAGVTAASPSPQASLYIHIFVTP